MPLWSIPHLHLVIPGGLEPPWQCATFPTLATPPIRQPNLADFAELVCRIVGFLNLADLFCQITRFLGLCRLVLPTCWGFWVLGHLRWSCSLCAFAGWVQCQRNVLLLLCIFLSFFWVTPARNGPGFQKCRYTN